MFHHSPFTIHLSPFTFDVSRLPPNEEPFRKIERVHNCFHDPDRLGFFASNLIHGYSPFYQYGHFVVYDFNKPALYVEVSQMILLIL